MDITDIQPGIMTKRKTPLTRSIDIWQPEQESIVASEQTLQ